MKHNKNEINYDLSKFVSYAQNKTKVKQARVKSNQETAHIINKKNSWHCQGQKTSRMLLASDFVRCSAIHARLSFLF